MTFQSAPHSVLPIIFKILRAFEPLFFNILKMGVQRITSCQIKPTEIWSPPLLELDFCPEKAVDLNGDLFSGRIENRCQLPIAEVYSDKAAAAVQ